MEQKTPLPSAMREIHALQERALSAELMVDALRKQRNDALDQVAGGQVILTRKKGELDQAVKQITEQQMQIAELTAERDQLRTELKELRNEAMQEGQDRDLST